jgi:acyl carrier protein
MSSISEQIKWFITHHILSDGDSGAEEIDHGTNLRESGILSSLWIMRLVSFLEDRFPVHFDALDFDNSNFSSIADIERLVVAKMGDAS